MTSKETAAPFVRITTLQTEAKPSASESTKGNQRTHIQALKTYTGHEGICSLITS